MGSLRAEISHQSVRLKRSLGSAISRRLVRSPGLWRLILKLIVPTSVELEFRAVVRLAPALLRKVPVDWESLDYRWRDSFRLWYQGSYAAAVALRRETMSQAFGVQGLDEDTFFQPLIAPDYTHNFGHLAQLALFARAIELGQIPKKNRFQVIRGRGNLEASNSLVRHFPQLDIWSDTRSMPEELVDRLLRDKLAPAWARSEDRNLPKTHQGFEDYYALWERVQKTSPVTRQNSPFSLSDRYLENSSRRLAELGVSPQSPIMSIHVRESSVEGSQDFRSASLDSYYSAIEAMCSRGYQVVRFGTPGMTALPKISGVVDLVSKLPADQSLDFYVLQRSAALISTVSGPAQVASMLGTPTLVTNATSIGRNCFRGAENSRFLPQRYDDTEGRELDFAAILESPVGYWEGLWPGRGGPPMARRNTREEILQATIEIMDLCEGSRKESPEISAAVTKQRRLFGAVNSGRLSETFIEAHPGWLG